MPRGEIVTLAFNEEERTVAPWLPESIDLSDQGSRDHILFIVEALYARALARLKASDELSIRTALDEVRVAVATSESAVLFGAVAHILEEIDCSAGFTEVVALYDDSSNGSSTFVEEIDSIAILATSILSA